MADPPLVRVIPHPDGADRVETGAVQFGNDWPGLFVRGDNAFHHAQAIDAIVRFLKTLPPEVIATADTELDWAIDGLRHIASVIRRDVIVTG